MELSLDLGSRHGRSLPRRILLVLVSAGLYGLVFPPWSSAWLAWVALAPLLLVVRDSTVAGATIAGLLWGTGAIWAIGYWAPPALAVYWGQSAWAGYLFCAGVSLVFFGVYSAMWAACAAHVCRRLRGRAFLPIVLAALWVAFDLPRTNPMFGDPWLLLGYALVPVTTLAQLADLGGVHALSFLVVLVNASLVELLRADRPLSWSAARALFPAAAALSATWLYGTVQIAKGIPERPAVDVLVVQGNNTLTSQWREEYYGLGLREYLELTLQGMRRGRPALVIWPESAVSFFLDDEPAYRAAIAEVLGATGTQIITGGPYRSLAGAQGPRYYNSAFQLDGDGTILGRYDKAHLLPFAEYYPLRTLWLLRRRFETVRTFTPGDGNRLLNTNAGRVGVAICFEAIFPGVIRRQVESGAEILVNLSNDAWLGSGPGPAQHLQMVILRAIENRRWLVRATTTGISAIIDPFGRMHETAGVDVAGALNASITPRQEVAGYSRYHDLFAMGCLAVAVLAMLWPVRRRREVGPSG